LIALISTLLTKVSAQDVVSDLLRKVAKPEPGEEMYMYAGILVCLAVLYIVYSQMNQKKPEFAEQLTMADVANQSGKNEISEEDKLL
jgi:hypothetical protein